MLVVAGIAQEEIDDEMHDRMESGMICSAVNTLADLEIVTTMCGCVSGDIAEIGAAVTKHVVSWTDIREASAEDAEIQELLNLVRTGFTSDARTLSCVLAQHNW